MPPDGNAPNFRLIDRQPEATDVKREVLEGLRRTPKTLPPKLFYDEEGSRLFEEITRLPEYYLTRTEVGVLTDHAAEINRRVGDTIIELGSGSSAKVRILLDQRQQPVTYVAVDISLDQLQASTEALAADYPRVSVVALCADYTKLFKLPVLPGIRTVFFPGSNLGNQTPEESKQFFKSVVGMLSRGDGMLIGVDRVKERAVLDAAYNDSRGITAAFNLNLLHRINRELGADFDVNGFRHVAFFNEEKSRMEMHLRSERPQTVTVAGERFEFAPGETIHTENSYKYLDGDIQRLIDGSGFVSEALWTDPRRWFSVHYLRVY
jgi:dimethylhistidine N-methyltransferase